MQDGAKLPGGVSAKQWIIGEDGEGSEVVRYR